MTDTTETVVDTTAPDANAPDQTDEVEQVQAESSPAVKDADESSEPKTSGVQRRIDELTWKLRSAERQAEFYRSQSQQPPKAEPVKAEVAKPLPKLEDFNYDEAAYQAAVTRHAAEEAARLVREEIRREQEETKKAERAKSWRTREAEFKKTAPDYEDLAYYAPISDAMAEVIQESDIGPQIAYFLGKPENRELAEQIASMDAVRAARALGKIEAKLEKPPAPAPKPVPAVSKAPPPPPRIEAVETAVQIRVDSPESDKLSDSDWVARRNKQLARRKG